MKEDAEEGHEASQERNKPQENSLSKILGPKITNFHSYREEK